MVCPIPQGDHKKKTIHRQFEYGVEKENSKECVVECGVVCMGNMDNDSSRQKEIRSHGNVDLEKDGENQLGGQSK